MNIIWDKIDPYIRIALRDTLYENFYFKRSIWDYELIYIEEGHFSLKINQKTTICSPGDFILIKPKQPHIISYIGENVVQPHIHFDLQKDELSNEIYVSFLEESKMSDNQKNWFRKDILNDLGIDLPSVIRIDDPSRAKKIFYRLIDETLYKDEFHNTMQRALIIELFIELYRGYKKTNLLNSLDKLVLLDSITQFIYHNISHKITLEMLAEHAGLSKWYFLRLFKERFGQTPKEYIDSIKIDRAKELITNTIKPIKEIALMVGFDTPQTFSRWFKLVDGKLPISYRR